MTSYKRSDKCELVYIPLAFNILDDEQRRDLLYILSAPNRAGRVRDCVRMVRCGMRTTTTSMDVEWTESDDVVTDAEILDGLL